MTRMASTRLVRRDSVHQSSVRNAPDRRTATLVPACPGAVRACGVESTLARTRSTAAAAYAHMAEKGNSEVLRFPGACCVGPPCSNSWERRLPGARASSGTLWKPTHFHRHGHRNRRIPGSATALPQRHAATSSDITRATHSGRWSLRAVGSRGRTASLVGRPAVLD